MIVDYPPQNQSPKVVSYYFELRNHFTHSVYIKLKVKLGKLCKMQKYTPIEIVLLSMQ
jgi:hypothetical protein